MDITRINGSMERSLEELFYRAIESTWYYGKIDTHTYKLTTNVVTKRLLNN